MKRETGYYHIRIHNSWEIAKWDSKLKVWMYKGLPWVDRDFDEIDEAGAMVERVRNEIRTWIRDKGNANLKKLAKV